MTHLEKRFEVTIVDVLALRLEVGLVRAAFSRTCGAKERQESRSSKGVGRRRGDGPSSNSSFAQSRVLRSDSTAPSTYRVCVQRVGERQRCAMSSRGRGTHLVRILDAKDPLAAEFASEEVVVEGCAEASEVQVASR